jgi:TRAP-type C4-dicarboxylate transport system permease small subunit
MPKLADHAARPAEAGWRAPVTVVYRAVVQVVSVVVNAALVCLVVVVLAAVVVRYTGLFTGSLHWTTEFGRFCTIWIVMLGSVVAFDRGAHVAIDLTDLVPLRFRRALRSLSYFLCLAFLAVLTWEGLQLSLATMRQVSPALGLPMGYAYLAVPVGAALMTLQSILLALVPDLAHRGAEVEDAGGAS